MIVSILIFAIFVLYVILRYGMENSISEQWYNLDRDKKIPLLEKGLFAIFCFGIAVPPLIVWFNSIGVYDWKLAFPFLGSMGIVFVGLAPNFKLNKLMNAIHLYGSYSGIFLWLIGLAIYGIYYPAAIFVAAGITLLVLQKKGVLNINDKKTMFTTLIEIAGFVTISLGIIFR